MNRFMENLPGPRPRIRSYDSRPSEAEKGRSCSFDAFAPCLVESRLSASNT